MRGCTAASHKWISRPCIVPHLWPLVIVDGPCWYRPCLGSQLRGEMRAETVHRRVNCSPLRHAILASLPWAVARHRWVHLSQLLRERSLTMRSLAIVALVMWLSVTGAGSAVEPSVAPFDLPATDGGLATLARFPDTLFIRTEVFFGTLKPDGSLVSEEAFLKFRDTEITPRFPNGLTLLMGLGQFLSAQGVIIQEPSRLLILFYPVEERRHNSEKIEQIRERYKQMFDQESVLRADRCCELVGF